MPKVSVIVPTYNREKEIEKCVSSILNQTLDDFELIIIDDGSTDNTKNIINRFNDDRLIYIKRDNHGIGSSRNYGIDLSKGEYLAFVDSDDYISEECLEKMYNKAKIEKLDIVVCDYYNFYQNGEINRENISSFDNTNLKDKKELLLEINLGPCNKLFNKKLFSKDMRFPEDIKYEDIALVCRLLKKANKIGKIDEPLNYFFVDNKSETTTVDKRVFDIFKSLDIIVENFKEKEYETIIKELVVFKLTIYTIQQRVQKDKRIRNKFINEAFNYMKKIDNEYKNNNYFKNRNKLKSFIEKNKTVTKIYCMLYNLIH